MPTTGTQAGSHQLSTTDQQRQVRLTAHPLQRVGAYAMAALVKAERPSDVIPDLFDRAVERMIDHAARAANAEKDDFFLKASRSFFPNSKMNHPSNGKRSAAENAGRIRGWRTMPDPSSWPGVPCALCGRDAVAFYGKVDVPLVEAEIHRNTTPPGHEGLALCWPCVCCFYALPYGCRLSGGPSAALHSWDDRFLEDATSRRCEATSREIMVGVQKPFGRYENEYVAVVGLKQYVRLVTADVDLIVFGNDNRGASLSVYPMGQPLAEWLRRTVREPALRAGRAELARAYSFPPVSGVRRFAYDAFHRPERIFDVMVDRLTGEPRSRSTGDDGGKPDRTRPAKAPDTRFEAADTRPRSRFHQGLAALCFSYAEEVMNVQQKDLAKILELARSVAEEIHPEDTAGALRGFRAELHRPRRLQNWLERRAVARLLSKPGSRPLYTPDQFLLLFDPDERGWLHRSLLLVGVVQKLHELGWDPKDGREQASEVVAEPESVDVAGLFAEDVGFVEGIKE